MVVQVDAYRKYPMSKWIDILMNECSCGYLHKQKTSRWISTLINATTNEYIHRWKDLQVGMYIDGWVCSQIGTKTDGCSAIT